MVFGKIKVDNFANEAAKQPLKEYLRACGRYLALVVAQAKGSMPKHVKHGAKMLAEHCDFCLQQYVPVFSEAEMPAYAKSKITLEQWDELTPTANRWLLLLSREPFGYDEAALKISE